MAENSQAVQSALRAHFARQAVLPRSAVDAAENFIAEVRAANGEPAATQAEQGRDLLRRLEDQTELFMFNAAVLAGMEAATEDDLARKLEKIGKGLEQAEITTARLRDTLKGFL